MKSLWTIKRIKGNLKCLAKKTGIDPLFVKILINRGIKEEKDIIKFFKGNLNYLYEPYLMRDMEKGITIIKNSIENNKNITIYGDYDVDGVSSTVILYKGLKRCGAKVTYHVPDREEEGYGMCINRVKKLKEDGTDVILTCDNGISALKEIEYAKELGMKVVVTDHHQIQNNTLPNADAIINPHRVDCEYPFKLLCGAGITYKFIQALYRIFNINNNETYELLQYAAIATVCDVVDLVDENRIIVKEGLKLINNTKSIGIYALLEVLGLLNKQVKSYHIGFQIGPCINATGRLETAALSIELFLCKDQNKAKELANTLYTLNKTRQDMTNENVEAIINQLNNKQEELGRVLVIYRNEVHESIAGIVAGKIKDHFNLPTIVLTDGKEMPKGSGRSIEGYDMFKELLRCKNLIYKFGGHPMAAGLSIKKENIEKLREQLNLICTLTKEDLMLKIKLDHILPREFNDNLLMSYIQELEPYGKGNPRPLFGEKNVQVLKAYLLGKENNVIKLKIKIENTIFNSIMFNNIDEFLEIIKKHYGENELKKLFNVGSELINMDFVFSIDINEYLGRKNLQFIVKDFRKN